VIQTGTIAAVAVAFATFAGTLWPALSTAAALARVGPFAITPVQLLAVVTILFLTALNVRGLEAGRRGPETPAGLKGTTVARGRRRPLLRARRRRRAHRQPARPRLPDGRLARRPPGPARAGDGRCAVLLHGLGQPHVHRRRGSPTRADDPRRAPPRHRAR